MLTSKKRLEKANPVAGTTLNGDFGNHSSTPRRRIIDFVRVRVYCENLNSRTAKTQARFFHAFPVWRNQRRGVQPW